MKKFLTLFLTLCLVVSFAACFAVSANAEEEIKVSVGSSFEWNDNSGDAKTQMAWHKSGGKSADGLWKYQYYSVAKKIYKDMVAFGKAFAWSSKATDDDYGIGYARVSEYGLYFHPGYRADAVKVFTCPSGGTIQISTEIARRNIWQADSNTTPTSFAIYVEDRLVYPEAGGGDYFTLVSNEPQPIDVTVDVAKGERVRIHIGAINKTDTKSDQNGDGVTMKNTITYKAINENVAGDISDKTLENSRIEATYDQPTNMPNQGGNNNKLPTRNDGMSVGAIIGIVAGVVAVAGIAVVAVIVLKKKKQD